MKKNRVLSGSGIAVFFALSAGASCQAAPTVPTSKAPILAIEPVTIGKTVTVAADGSGDYKTVQEAVNAAPNKSATLYVIRIKAGKYEDNIIVPKNKTNIVFEGDGADKTIISWNRSVYDPKPEGADGFNPGVFVAGNDFRASNLTIENAAGDRGQALALRVDGDRARFENCHILGWQDTLMANNGRQYFKDCTIAGRVDFIYGSGTTVFENCELHSKNGGYVTAASTPQERPYGFVFLNCKLTADAEPWIDPTTGQPKGAKGALALLGRPWRPYASVTYINCEMGPHIRPEGWSNWGRAENEKTARYAEYRTKTLEGELLDISKRAPWSKQLTTEEAAQYTIANILGGTGSDKPFGKKSTIVLRPAAPIVAPVGSFPAQNVTIFGPDAALENHGANIGYWTDTETSFEWKSNLPLGVYSVSLNYSLDPAQAGSEIEVAVGGKKLKFTPSATGGWGTYKTVEVGEVEVKQLDVPITVSALSQKGNFILNLREVVLSKK